MKKIIAILIIMLLALSLSGCGTKVEYICSDMYITAEGVGTRSVTVSFSGDLGKYSDRTVNVPQNSQIEIDGETTDVEAPFTVEEKISGEVLSYKVKPAAQGASQLTVYFKNGNTVVRTVDAMISVDDKKKIANVSFSVWDKIEDIFSEFESEGTVGEISTNEDRASQELKIASETDSWTVTDYDQFIVSVSEKEFSDGYSKWTISALDAGDTVVELKNSQDGSDLYVSVICTETDGVLSLNIDGTASVRETPGLTGEEVESGLTHNVQETIVGEDGEEEVINVIKPLFEDMYVPKNGKIISAGTDSFEEEGDDSAEIELELDGMKLLYLITKECGRDEYLKKATDGLDITSTEEFEAAGRNIKLICHKTALAGWEENDHTCILYILGDGKKQPSAEDARKVIEDFFK